MWGFGVLCVLMGVSGPSVGSWRREVNGVLCVGVLVFLVLLFCG